MTEKIAVIGLGYVGLPVAVALAEKYPGTLGFDINATRIAELQQGQDHTGEVDHDRLRVSGLRCTADLNELRGSTFFVVAVPTPIDGSKRPDLTPVLAASRSVGTVLSPGAVVVYESTVYPGVTEDLCGPILAEVSGLTQGKDFFLGYSPERINPGDREHTFERITKVVSGENADTLERVARVYGSVVEAGVHRAPSIRVAEAAKVIENTQRDLNIALMNELALIFDRIGLSTQDVLAAASTKWNFLRFHPGLVGGHCIGVDPYYLTTLAESVGYHPEVILAGRRINEEMARFVGRKLVRMLGEGDIPLKQARVGILGLTFKPNVPDLRNTKVIDLLEELRGFGLRPQVHDPWVSQAEARHEYGLELSPREALEPMDALILAVPHRVFLEDAELMRGLVDDGIVIDVFGALKGRNLSDRYHYWSL